MCFEGIHLSHFVYRNELVLCIAGALPIYCMSQSDTMQGVFPNS